MEHFDKNFRGKILNHHGSRNMNKLKITCYMNEMNQNFLEFLSLSHLSDSPFRISCWKIDQVEMFNFDKGRGKEEKTKLNLHGNRKRDKIDQNNFIIISIS